MPSRPAKMVLRGQNNELLPWPPKSPNLSPVNVLDQQVRFMKAPSPTLHEGNTPSELPRSSGLHASAGVTWNTDEENRVKRSSALYVYKRWERGEEGDMDGSGMRLSGYSMCLSFRRGQAEMVWTGPVGGQ